nr:MAG TPA: hypothetical protein [Bacteriophage sp.]
MVVYRMARFYRRIVASGEVEIYLSRFITIRRT